MIDKATEEVKEISFQQKMLVGSQNFGNPQAFFYREYVHLFSLFRIDESNNNHFFDLP